MIVTATAILIRPALMTLMWMGTAPSDASVGYIPTLTVGELSSIVRGSEFACSMNHGMLIYNHKS